MAGVRALYGRLLQKYPTTMQSLQAGVLMGAGDASAQVLVEGADLNTYQWTRTARFLAIGTLFVGPSLKVWYGVLDKTFGSGTVKIGLKKVALDQCLFAPSFIAAFLTVNGATLGHNVQEISQEIRKSYKDILVTNYTIWPAVQVCNFSLVPLQYQVLVVQVVALFWNTYLAWKINKKDE